MIVCTKIKTVFIAIPKTGTRSIGHALKNKYGISSCGVHALLVPSQYHNFFSFTVVRNPYDRVCSLYWSMCQRKGDRNEYRKKLSKNKMCNTLENFLLLFYNYPQRHQLPQSHWLEPNRIDQVIRFETLQEDFNTLPFLTTALQLPHCNSTTTHRTQATEIKRPNWRKMITPEAGQLIDEIYADDFDQLQYAKEEFQ